MASLIRGEALFVLFIILLEMSNRTASEADKVRGQNPQNVVGGVLAEMIERLKKSRE